MRLNWCHLLATTVLVGVAPATAAGCASSKEDPSSPGADSDSGTGGGGGGGGTMDGPRFAEAGTDIAEGGTDSASIPDRAVPETGPVDDSGSGADASLDSGFDAGPNGRPDSGPDAADAGAIGVPPGCALSSPVSFKNEVQPFLASSCGNAGGGSGCHVLDATSTVAQGGYDHAYDWITGTAHSSSCPETPTPFRFQVVMAVLTESDPPSCSRCPEMPPTTGSDLRTPLTACQTATLQSWLGEPLVTQTHRNDGISPLTPYPMPPFD